jgi:tRNA-specific 2-thiouridylase
MKIAVAMSGGIDSSLAAIILKEEGYEVIGITARFLPASNGYNELYEASIDDAKKIARLYNFPHFELNFSSQFQERVIDYFCDEYISGKTPNPCVICNRYVKFSCLIDAAADHGCDMIATGPYAIKKEAHGRFYLSMSPDTAKDQSYFLYMLSQEQLSKSIFPLGSLTKRDIRLMAARINLPLKDKPDSQEICFVPDNDYISFIERHANPAHTGGNIVDSKGNILGRHNGIYRYTIGQRRGMGISHKYPLYVTSIDSKNNQIYAGPKEELFIKSLETRGCYHMKHEIKDEIKGMIKCRSTQRAVEGIISRDNDRFKVEFTEPQIGISHGQSAVFYDEDNDIIGGGIIDKTYSLPISAPE